MIPFARALRRYDGVAVARLRYDVRGWNGSDCSPVPDARWALGRLADRYPGVPAALVGHSMGGRVALTVADEPPVRAVVALAPWIEPGDTTAAIEARRVLVAHGADDRVTDPVVSAAFARRARTTYVSVRGDGHAMLRRAPVWHELATIYMMAALSGELPAGDTDVRNIVSRALAGEASLVV
jgi:pimeloyl-ACP methyl ester carboxylesterase